MKRTTAHIGLTSFCVLAVAFYLPANAVYFLMGAASAAAVIFLLIKKTRKTVFLPVIAITAALACGVNLIYSAAVVKPVITEYCGEKQKVEATLTDESYCQYNKYYYPLTTDSVGGKEARLKILLKTSTPLDIEPFEKIRFTADITPTESNYFIAKGYYITVDTKKFSYTAKKADSYPLYYHVIQLRQAMREAIETYLPEDEANLCKAVLIGDKYAPDQEIKDEFRTVGASHFIVVSGMHYSVVVLMSLWLFRRLFRKRYIYYPLTYLVIVLYMLIAGFQPSVIRSGVMMLILITGQVVRRESDPLTSLGIAALAMPFIFSPYGCGDIGMILSFAATFSIIMWATPIYEKLSVKKDCDRRLTRLLKKGANAVIAIISASIAANILVLPLSVFAFNGFSVMTILSTLLLSPLIWLTMSFSLLLCAFFYLGPLRYLSLLLSWPLYIVTKAALYAVHLTASFPYAYIHVRSLYFYIWVAVTLALGLIAYFLRKRYRLYRAVALFSAILFCGGFIVNSVIQMNTDKLVFQAGKNSAAIYLNHYGRLHILRFDCDSSSSYAIRSQLLDEYGGAHSAVCIYDREVDNYSRMAEREFAISHYLVTKDQIDSFDVDQKTEVMTGKSVYLLDDGVVLHTIEKEKKTMLYLTDGKKSVMLLPTGFSYADIPSDMRQADVIFINRSGKNYQKLSCDSLVVCSSDKDDKDNKKKLSLPACNHQYSLNYKHIEFRMN